MDLSERSYASPLLDDFALGEAMSHHDGVRCYPAMRADSDERYIVKVISIPASQVQLDALILTGAYSDKDTARAYFKDLAENVALEASFLTELSQYPGFLAYDGHQVVPTPTGYQVTLLSPYKRSLEKFMRRNPITHLSAVNLGIDLCQALALCRKSGALCIDLKPSNIFYVPDQGYCYGDLGFMPLSSLQFASMPQRYLSSWTAPEVRDAFSDLNTTMDVYSLGLILYQAYNGGKLPFEGRATDAPLPAPAYADYEMAEIILKACAPKPEDRWQDPVDMGQALIAYLQRNRVNDTPIMPPVMEGAPEESQAQPKQSEAVLSELDVDDTLPNDADLDDLDDTVLTEDGSDILAMAEDLIALEAPAPAVAPEPTPLPELSDEPQEASDEVQSEPEDEPAEPEQEPLPRKKYTRFLTTLLVLVLLALAAAGLYYFYSNYVLQPVTDFSAVSADNTLTVSVVTQADESLLTAVCADTYGNAQRAPIQGGKAVFTELQPATQYKLTLEISGLHRLVGPTTVTCSTPVQTNIVSFSVIAGAEDGSAVLRFTPDGPEPSGWFAVYSTPGEEEKTAPFTSHMATVTGLTVGSVYTFRLVPAEALFLVGESQLEFTAAKLILASDLVISDYQEGSLTVSWNAPPEASVDTWTVRCYSDSGYDETQSVTKTTAVFTGISSDSAYTVDVTAAGMTQSARTSVSANPVTVTAIHGDLSNPLQLGFSWDFTGNAPDGGWLLLYALDGSDTQEVVRCDSNSGQIEPRIPGSRFVLTLQAANSATVFGGSFAGTVPDAEEFTGYGLRASRMTLDMYNTPEGSDWTWRDLRETTTVFAPDGSATVRIHTDDHYDPEYDSIVTLFVVRDAEGTLVSAETSTAPWASMWNLGYCPVTLPKLPDQPGEYTVDIFFNGASIGRQTFTIEQPVTEE